MKTNYKDIQKKIDNLKAMMPIILDYQEMALSLPSFSISDFNAKAHVVDDLIDLKDDLIKLIALSQAQMIKKKTDFINEQEGLSNDFN